jgi:PKD repeat protein
LPQPSPAKSGDVIDTSDTRLTQATAAYDPSPNVKALAVWTQHTIASPSGGPSVVRWYELRPGSTSAALVQDGTIDDSAANLFAFNGAIAPTRVGNAAAIDYNTGSGSALVTVRAQARAAGQAAGTMGNETTLAASTQVDDDFTCPSVTGGSRPCRWGDYAAASPDPSAGCGSAVWGSNQDNGVAPAFTNAAVWATQNFELLTDECPKAAFTFSAGTGNTENFDGSGSTDADGSIGKWVWNFGDKTTQTTTVPTTSHTYAAAGTYKVTVSVTDSSGLTVSVSHSVSVA